MPNAATLDKVLAESARLVLLLKGNTQERAEAMEASGHAHVVAKRPDEARRLLLRAAIAAIASSATEPDVPPVFRKILQDQVELGDNVGLADSLRLTADKEKSLSDYVRFLKARLASPPDSPLRIPNEYSAFAFWRAGSDSPPHFWSQEELAQIAMPFKAWDTTKETTAANDDELIWTMTRIILRLTAHREEVNANIAAQTLLTKYLPHALRTARSSASPLVRSRGLWNLAYAQEAVGNSADYQSLLAESLQAATASSSPQGRFDQLHDMSLPIDVALVPSSDRHKIPELPGQIREHILAAIITTLDTTAVQLPGETAAKATERYTRNAEWVRGTLKPDVSAFRRPQITALLKAVAIGAKKLPPDARSLALRRIARIQTLSDDLNSAFITLHQDPDTSRRFLSILSLAQSEDRISIESEDVQSKIYAEAISTAHAIADKAKRFRIMDEYITENRDSGNRFGASVILPEALALLPASNNLLKSPTWSDSSESLAAFVWRLGRNAQVLGQHSAARTLLARSAAIAIKEGNETSLLMDIAYAQAFSGDFARARATLQAAVDYVPRMRFADDPNTNIIGKGKASYLSSLASQQAGIRDFNGALQTVELIPRNFSVERSLALSTIALRLVEARAGLSLPAPTQG